MNPYEGDIDPSQLTQALAEGARDLGGARGGLPRSPDLLHPPQTGTRQTELHSDPQGPVPALRSHPGRSVRFRPPVLMSSLCACPSWANRGGSCTWPAAICRRFIKRSWHVPLLVLRAERDADRKGLSRLESDSGTEYTLFGARLEGFSKPDKCVFIGYDAVLDQAQRPSDWESVGYGGDRGVANAIDV